MLGTCPALLWLAGIAVEGSRQAASESFNPQGFGVRLCRRRFSFCYLVNPCFKSVLPDSRNRFGLPVARYPD